MVVTSHRYHRSSLFFYRPAVCWNVGAICFITCELALVDCILNDGSSCSLTLSCCFVLMFSSKRIFVQFRCKNNDFLPYLGDLERAHNS
jgi:hypothetical protein